MTKEEKITEANTTLTEAGFTELDYVILSQEPCILFSEVGRVKLTESLMLDLIALGFGIQF